MRDASMSRLLASAKASICSRVRAASLKMPIRGGKTNGRTGGTAACSCWEKAREEVAKHTARIERFCCMMLALSDLISGADRLGARPPEVEEVVEAANKRRLLYVFEQRVEDGHR